MCFVIPNPKWKAIEKKLGAEKYRKFVSRYNQRREYRHKVFQEEVKVYLEEVKNAQRN